jgi:endoglucanase
MGDSIKARSLADTLVKLDNSFGVTGDEEETAEALKEEMRGLYDEYFADTQGNQVYVRYGKNRDKRVLLAAHMDEIGYVIKSIDKSGFARVFPVGLHDDRMAINQVLVFRTAEGKKVQGVTGAKPAHIVTEEERGKAVPIGELFVDFGSGSAEETRSLGLEIGDYGTFDRAGHFLNGTDYYTGKSIDDRGGLAVLVEVMRRLKGRDIEPAVYMAGSVQEETGMRAGNPLVNRIKPELFLAVDGTIPGDIPPLGYEECSQKLGDGVGIKFYDWDPIVTCGNNVPRKLTNRMIAVAKKHGIPFQREVIMGGGTDAWNAWQAGTGCLAGGISIPMRYMHSAVGVLKLSDLDICVDYLVKYLEDYVTL